MGNLGNSPVINPLHHRLCGTAQLCKVVKVTGLDSERMQAHVAWVNCYKAGAPAGELSGHCVTLCFVLPPRNSSSPCRVLILAAFTHSLQSISVETPGFWG